MCPHCGAELDEYPMDTPGCFDVFCLECDYSAHIIGQAAEAPDLHPLVDGRRACFGEEEAATCDECGRPFLAEEAAYSRWNGKPICPRCKQVQDSEQP